METGRKKDIGGWLHLSDGQSSGDPRMGKERLDQFLNIHTGSAQGGSWGLLARPIQVALHEYEKMDSSWEVFFQRHTTPCVNFPGKQFK